MEIGVLIGQQPLFVLKNRNSSQLHHPFLSNTMLVFLLISMDNIQEDKNLWLHASSLPQPAGWDLQVGLELVNKHVGISVPLSVRG